MASLVRPASLAVLILAAAAMAGCNLLGGGTTATSTATATATPDDGGGDGGSETISVHDLDVGMCFDDPPQGDEIIDIEIVDCETPHDNEVYAVLEVRDEGSFPGQDALRDFADTECRGDTFEDYVGTNYDESELFFTALWPTEGSWDAGDREVVCVLYHPDEKLTGSMRDSNR